MVPVTLRCAEQGRGEPLVLLHPAGLDHSFWPELIERCAATHRVLALDLPGRGRSPTSAEASMAGYAEAVKGTLDTPSVGTAAVLGHAMPTPVVAGEMGRGTPVSAARAIADAVPGAHLIVLPGAPQMLQIESAGPFVRHVSALLEERR